MKSIYRSEKSKNAVLQLYDRQMESLQNQWLYGSKWCLLHHYYTIFERALIRQKWQKGVLLWTSFLRKVVGLNVGLY